jgi:outer membrane protein
MSSPRRAPHLRLLRLLRPVALSTLLACGAGSAVLLGAAPASAQSAPRVAVIDVRRAVLETEQGLRVQATLKKLFDSRQVELDAKTRQLQQDKETLEKEAQQNKISKEALQKKYETLVKQDAELQRTTLDYQREMQRREQEMTTPILQGILEAVKRIAAQEGFEMVLEKSAVPYFRADLELTDRAIQMYNSGQGALPKGKPAAPGAPGPALPSAPAAPPAAPPAKAPAPAPKK